jgi:hypothetical protein
MKILGSFALLLGLGLFLFAILSYSELRTAATSENAPAVDAMPLTRIVGPELFDPDHVQTKPAVLASIALNRIFMIGGSSFFFVMLGVLLLVLGQVRRSPPNAA